MRLLAVLLTATLTGLSAARPPNIVLILTDDQGSVDASCYGTGDIETPNIDRLAATGTRFTQFYAAAPVCSPSRAGFLTGRYPVRAGVPSNVGATNGLPPEERTVAELFSSAGYATAHIGKWHLGHTPDKTPNAQGFESSFGHLGGCIDNYSHFFYWNGPNRHDLVRDGEEVFHDGEFFPDLMADEATAFISQNRDRPFLIYFAINCPHYPYQGDTRWLDYYNSRKIPHPRNLYNAFVSTLDARIGTLIDHLEALGLRDDTILVFQSDHGHSTEQRAHYGGGSAGPFRGAKFSLFEGGIRVPAIVSWPGGLPQGVTSDALAHSCDWFPTLAELAGIKVPNDRHIDGKSLAHTIRERAPSPHETVHWQVGTDPKKAQWAVRKGRWKLVGNPRDTTADPEKKYPAPGSLFLSDLESDPGESKNFASEHPEIVAELEKLHESHLAISE